MGKRLPRLGPVARGPATGKVIISLFAPEEDAVQVAMGARLPHAQLVPMLVAARDAAARYRAWSSSWDDPVV